MAQTSPFADRTSQLQHNHHQHELMMSNISICNLLRVLVAAYLLASDQAAAEPSSQPKKGVAFTSDLTKRNLGGQFKDWYLSKFTHNYFCTDRGRLVPVDPGTGHMLLKGLRKRSNWIDDFFGLSHDTEHGLCKNRRYLANLLHPDSWLRGAQLTCILILCWYSDLGVAAGLDAAHPKDTVRGAVSVGVCG